MKRERTNSKVNILKEERQLHRLITIGIVTVFVIFITCTLFGNLLTSAHDSREAAPVNFKYYKSVIIQPGDTLWNIAETYITEDYDSVPAYVKALKELNSLSSDEIQAGCHLMIAYNDTQFIRE